MLRTLRFLSHYQLSAEATFDIFDCQTGYYYW